MEPVLSLRWLASRLGFPVTALRELAEDIKPHYRETSFRYGPGLQKVRRLRVPKGPLKQVQKRLYENVLLLLPLSPAAHGGVRGRSPRSNAEQHLRQACLVTLDVEQFFESVTHRQVYRMFRHALGFGRDVARLLTRLSTFDGRLPQGAPTSPVVANLVLAHSVDREIAGEAQRLGVNFTRFVDDIALSGDRAPALIAFAGRALSRQGLTMHRQRKGATSKLRISRSGKPQEVTGLNVARGKAGVSQKHRHRIRAAIFQLPSAPTRAARTEAVSSIRGRISHVRTFHPAHAAALQSLLANTLAGLTEIA